MNRTMKKMGAVAVFAAVLLVMGMATGFAVDDEFDVGTAKAAGVQQHGALRGGAVGGDRFALALAPADELAQRRTDEAVSKELDKSNHVFEFTPNMSFAEAIEQIKYCVDPPLPIVVIWKDLLDNADIDRTTPANMDEISGVSPGRALRLLLASVSGGYDRLGYIVEDGIIMIATVESLPEQWETRVYDISDLL